MSNFNGWYKMDAFDFRYMKRIRFKLRSLGAWPVHVFEASPTTKLAAIRRYGYTSFLFLMCSLLMVGQVMYLIKNKETLGFVDLGQTFLTLLMCCVFVQRAMLPLQATYQAIFKEFASNFHLIHCRNKTEFSTEMYHRVNYICENATIIGYLQIYACLFMFNMAPLYVNYKTGMYSSERPVNGTFDLSVFYLLPFDQTNSICYTITCLCNWYLSYNMASMLVVHDLMICVFVFHIWGHMKIYEHNINHFPRPSSAVNAKIDLAQYSKEETEEVALRLKEIIQHYIMIKEFVAKTSETYSVTLCVYFGFHLVSDCVLLLECSTLNYDALAKYGLLTVAIYQQLIQISVVFELISSKGDSLIDAVYSLPWECMDNSNRRTVLLLLHIVQQPLALKACGMVPVGVQTMLAILKASFSYFLMLRTFAAN